jgi:NADH dehydrogenase FAD-containing subunit
VRNCRPRQYRIARQETAMSRGLDKIDPEHDVKISLVEAGDRMPSNIAEATCEVLRKPRIDVKTKARVTEVTSEGISLADGDFIPLERSRGQPLKPARRETDAAGDT